MRSSCWAGTCSFLGKWRKQFTICKLQLELVLMMKMHSTASHRRSAEWEDLKKQRCSWNVFKTLSSSVRSMTESKNWVVTAWKPRTPETGRKPSKTSRKQSSCVVYALPATICTEI